MFSFLRRKHILTTGIGAIFKNEFPYILEWVAWHLSQGFNKLIIYDNNSTDGSQVLLKELNNLGLIDFYTINETQGAQVPAYEAILKQYKKELDIITFIDADEFLVSQDEQLASTHLQQLFSDAAVTAVGINWRVFGSNGHNSNNGDCVLRRFTLAANDSRIRNHYIKSAYRPAQVKKIFPHRATLGKGSQYINTAGKSMVFANNEKECLPVLQPTTTGMSYSVCNERLRVHHYAVKSKEEFIAKKFKGDAMWGESHIKTDGYFISMDLNDEPVAIPNIHLSAFEQNYQQLLQQVTNEVE